jgi:ATP-binding cassette, subfamily C, bacterial LapB
MMALGIAASSAISVLSLAVPLAIFQTYDCILPNQAYRTTVVLALGVLIAVILEAVLRYSRAVLFAYVGSAIEAQGTVGLLNHVMHADGRALHRLPMPVLTNAFRAVWEIRDFWSGNAAAALHELPFAAIYVVLIGYIAGWLALIPLSLTIVAALVALAVFRSTASAMEQAKTAQLEQRNLG